MFYIKKIVLVTGNGIQSTVEFDAGLNIVYGESNTGKSLIIDCIDYMFGASENRFDPKLELKEIRVLLDVDGHNLTMSRKIGSTSFEVSSLVPEIDSGTYKTGKSQKSISNLWLHLMGIKNEVQIIKTTTGKSQRLTLRTFHHIMLIDEQRVQDVSSVLSSGIGFNKKVSIPVMSALLYLATGENYLPDKVGKDKVTRKERKDAVKKFVDRSMSKLSKLDKNTELQNPSKESPDEIRQKMEQTLNAIGAVEDALEDAANRSRAIADKIIKIDSQIAESRVLHNRNVSLQTQYDSDIKRLTFIVDGDIRERDIPKLDRCPFCNGELPKGKEESCMTAAMAEVSKIEAQIRDLRSVQEAITTEMNELTNARCDLVEQRRQIDTRIRAELRPQISELHTHLANYTLALNQNKAKELIESFGDVLVSELRTTEEEESTVVDFKVSRKFNEAFENKLNKILKNLLEECNYQNFTATRFDSDDYDVVVNGHQKKSQGKGFRAFLNTILAIALQNCLEEYNKYQLGLLVMDSPILSLKEKEDYVGEEHISETMKAGLFKYLLSHQNRRQTIIIENEIPKLDYSSAHLEEFTKDENRGRYGLVTGYRD